jgi:predicted phage baseplate assembly protein
LLPVSRGKTITNEVLGGGDASIAGQSFKLAKAPVTYLMSGSTIVSTIAIRVDGRPWLEVPSFLDQSPTAEVFVTREDEAGETHVDFGDGVNGARLPTGTNNVVATYRVGAGAASPAAGKLTVIAKSFPGLKSVLNPVAVGGGADPDPPALIAKFAPRSVLTFGRAVSVFDYQALAAQAPGVTRARATWSWDDAEQRAVVAVHVGDDAAAFVSATEVLAAAGDPNRPVAVVLAGDPANGLFAPTKLDIGETVFNSMIDQAVLAIEGVVAVSALTFSMGNPPVVSPGELHSPGEGNYFAPITVSIVTQAGLHG